MKISVVVPANNEEIFLGRCLASINDQVTPVGTHIETIVVLNRCTDDTESVANAYGAIVTFNGSKNISAIKNTSIAQATNEWIVTIDADSSRKDNF